jgi:phosphatidylserine decarboxylase
MTAVGATNVGSIVVNFDKDLVTNQWPRPRKLYYEKIINLKFQQKREKKWHSFTWDQQWC